MIALLATPIPVLSSPARTGRPIPNGSTQALRMPIEDVLADWAIGEVAALLPLPSAGGGAQEVRTAGGERFVLKRRGRGPAPVGEHAMLCELAAAGLPVAVPLRTAAGVTFAAHEDALYELLPWLPGTRGGELRAQDPKAWAARFGTVSARVHRALAALPAVPAAPAALVLDPVLSLEGWVVPALERHGETLDLPRLRKAVASTAEVLRAHAAALPTQRIHRDLHPDNLLFEGTALTAVLDFELSCVGPRLFDLAYCGTSMLLADWGARPKRAQWPAALTGLLAAYDGENPLQPAERASLFAMLCLIQLMFIAFAADNADHDTASVNQAALFWLEDNRRWMGL